MVISVTGGGLSGASILLSSPGASATVLEVNCPYSRQSFIEHVAPSNPPSSFASPEAALLLARASLARARALCFGEQSVEGARLAVGVGAAAALVSLTPRSGAHRCHVALCSDEREIIWCINLAKGAREREEEEMVCGRGVVGAALTGANLFPAGVDIQEGMASVLGASFGAVDGDSLTHVSTILSPPLVRLLAPFSSSSSSNAPAPAQEQLALNPPAITHLFYPPISGHPPIPNAPLLQLAPPRQTTTSLAGAAPPTLLLLPGSFNPLHQGHTLLGEAALSTLALYLTPDSPPPLLVYELSAANVDKPSLEVEEVEKRVAAFTLPPHTTNPPSPLGHRGVCVTASPTFIQKAALFPGAAFAVGWDTAARIVSPLYYSGGEAGMLRALETLMVGGTVFLVAGRRAGSAPLPKDWGGDFPTPDAFLTLGKHLLPRVPAYLHKLFIEIPEEKFRVDLSSSEIRKRGTS